MVYNEDKVKEAYELSAMFGATEKQLAVYWGVSLPTIALWKNTHEDFALALQQGKLKADIEVAKALYRNAVGFEYEEEVAFNNKGVILKTMLRKQRLPDAWSEVKWLGLRQELWRETSRVEVTNTNININRFEVLNGLDTEQLMLLETIAKKQLTEHVGNS
jgi:hypothetical protein